MVRCNFPYKSICTTQKRKLKRTHNKFRYCLCNRKIRIQTSFDFLGVSFFEDSVFGDVAQLFIFMSLLFLALFMCFPLLLQYTKPARPSVTGAPSNKAICHFDSPSNCFRTTSCNISRRRLTFFSAMTVNTRAYLPLSFCVRISF